MSMYLITQNLFLSISRCGFLSAIVTMEMLVSLYFVADDIYFLKFVLHAQVF